MSELIDRKSQACGVKRRLLTGVSVAAMSVGIFSGSTARAEDMDHPQVWIEVGGEAARLGNRAEIFAPPFFADTPEADLTPMLNAQKPVPYSLEMDGKISFTPDNSHWVLSASVQYGRSNSNNHNHQQTPLPYVKQFVLVQILPQPSDQQFGDGQASLKESHLVLDFQTGKDVGIGLFGLHGSSIVSVGVRYAQFTESASVTLNARPYDKIGAVNTKYFQHYVYTPAPPHFVTVGIRNVDLFRHTYAAMGVAKRSSHGIGPSLSWDASLPVLTPDSDTTVNFDWGVNASVLFGRQRTKVQHKTNGHQYSRTGLNKYQHTAGYAHTPVPRSSPRSVTMPNVGGFAGLSFKFPNAQVKMGYRADVFFGAIDGGIDTPKSQNRSFYGPFASVSIGLGG